MTCLDGKEVEFVRNAGSMSKGLSIEESHSAIRLNYTGGNTCVNMSRRNSTYRTNIDFLCNQVSMHHPLCYLRQSIIIFLFRVRTSLFTRV